LKIILEEIIFSHSEDSNNKLIIICKNYYTLILHGGESLNLDADERFFTSNRQSTRAPQYNLIPCHSHARTNVATMLQTFYLSSLSHFFPAIMTPVCIETTSISSSREIRRVLNLTADNVYRQLNSSSSTTNIYSSPYKNRAAFTTAMLSGRGQYPSWTEVFMYESEILGFPAFPFKSPIITPYTTPYQ